MTVAALDTGVNAKLADVSANLVCTMVKSNSCNDGYGHGTHVIGILKGRDVQGRSIGVAPDAQVISVKVADDTGESMKLWGSGRAEGAGGLPKRSLCGV